MHHQSHLSKQTRHGCASADDGTFKQPDWPLAAKLLNSVAQPHTAAHVAQKQKRLPWVCTWCRCWSCSWGQQVNAAYVCCMCVCVWGYWVIKLLLFAIEIAIWRWWHLLFRCYRCMLLCFRVRWWWPRWAISRNDLCVRERKVCKWHMKWVTKYSASCLTHLLLVYWIHFAMAIDFMNEFESGSCLKSLEFSQNLNWVFVSYKFHTNSNAYNAKVQLQSKQMWITVKFANLCRMPARCTLKSPLGVANNSFRVIRKHLQPNYTLRALHCSPLTSVRHHCTMLIILQNLI